MEKNKLRCFGTLMTSTLLLFACGQQDQSNESASETELTLSDGTYQASAHGYMGDIQVEVTVEGGQLESVEILEHGETEAVTDRSFPLVIDRIESEQSPDVHAVSGSTISSNAVKRAVADALQEAGSEEIDIRMNTGLEDDDRELQEKEDHMTDLVIVGGGPSGLSAAIEAKRAGVENVTVIEKMDILSGNGKFDMNFYDMPNSQAMENNDVEVSPQEFKAYQREEKEAWETDERLDIWTEIAFTLDEWLREMGVELNHNYGGEKGMNHMAEEDRYAGNDIQHGLESEAEELGVEFIMGTKADGLYIEEGKATGVSVRDRESQYDVIGESVVLATGGFSVNDEMLEEYAPGAEQVETSNQIGATGDGITMAEENDLQLNQMDNLRIFPLIVKPTRDLSSSNDGYILVNNKGERFMPENLGGLDRAHAMLDQPDSEVYVIYDQERYESQYRLQKQVDEGINMVADSLEDLAEELDVDAQVLQAEMDEFNAQVDKGGEDAPSEVKINYDGKLYYAPVEAAVHMTKGGIVADENARVLDQNDNVVESLYAAGEVTDQSGGYSQSVVFGRLAGERAAKEILENQ